MIGTGFADLLLVQTIQVSALAVLIWLLVRIMAKDRPHLAHALWALVLLKCVTPPVFASPISPFSWFADSHPTIRARGPSAGERLILQTRSPDLATRTTNRTFQVPKSTQYLLYGAGGSIRSFGSRHD